MMITSEPLLIASAPEHILVGLGLFFTIAAAALFCQAFEQGRYPGLRTWLCGLRRFFRQRQRRRRWVYYAFGGARSALSA